MSAQQISLMNKSRLSAIHPCFALTYRDFEDFIAEFGPHKWRFVADLADTDSSTWAESFSKWTENFSDLERKKVENLCQRGMLKGAVIKNARSKYSLKWHEATSKENNLFNLIVGHSVVDENHMRWQEALSILRDPEHETQSFDLPMSKKSLLEECKFLAMHTTPMYVVDPFFSPIANRLDQREIAIELFKLVMNYNCREIHFISRDIFCCGNSSGDRGVRETLQSLNVTDHRTYAQLLLDVFSPIKQGDTKLFSHLVNDSHRGQRRLDLHIRYVFNKYGGLEFDKGLSTHKGGATQPVKAIARGYLQDSIWPNYMDHVILFEENYPIREGQKRPVSVTTFRV